MSQSRTCGTAGLRPIALELPLPAYYTCYPLWLGDCRIASARTVRDTIRVSSRTSISFVSSIIACWAREVVEVAVGRGIGR
jgi:hypothetical protein